MSPVPMEPPVTPTTEPFWEATRTGVLLLQWCTACERPIFYPREVCPFCLGSALEWRPASGHGTVYAVTVEHHPMHPAMAAIAPYPVALVELDEGVRMMTRLVHCPNPAVGLSVNVTWEELTDGRQLPLFEPAMGG
jgi:uncharacterized OB-fold protein